MNEYETQQKLLIAISEEYANVYDKYIKRFVEEKQAILFEAFMNTSVNDIESLRNIKLQSTVFESLKNEFLQYADSGKVAKFNLDGE